MVDPPRRRRNPKQGSRRPAGTLNTEKPAGVLYLGLDSIESMPAGSAVATDSAGRRRSAGTAKRASVPRPAPVSDRILFENGIQTPTRIDPVLADRDVLDTSASIDSRHRGPIRAPRRPGSARRTNSAEDHTDFELISGSDHAATVEQGLLTPESQLSGDEASLLHPDENDAELTASVRGPEIVSTNTTKSRASEGRRTDQGGKALASLHVKPVQNHPSPPASLLGRAHGISGVRNNNLSESAYEFELDAERTADDVWTRKRARSEYDESDAPLSKQGKRENIKSVATASFYGPKRNGNGLTLARTHEQSTATLLDGMTELPAPKRPRMDGAKDDGRLVLEMAKGSTDRRDSVGARIMIPEAPEPPRKKNGVKPAKKATTVTKPRDADTLSNQTLDPRKTISCARNFSESDDSDSETAPSRLTRGKIKQAFAQGIPITLAKPLGEKETNSDDDELADLLARETEDGEEEEDGMTPAQRLAARRAKVKAQLADYRLGYYSFLPRDLVAAMSEAAEELEGFEGALKSFHAEFKDTQLELLDVEEEMLGTDEGRGFPDFVSRETHLDDSFSERIRQVERKHELELARIQRTFEFSKRAAEDHAKMSVKTARREMLDGIAKGQLWMRIAARAKDSDTLFHDACEEAEQLG